MDTTSVICFKSPPLPYVIEAVQIEVTSNSVYPARVNLGIFKLVYVREGALQIIEDEKTFSIKSGEYIVIRPDCSYTPEKLDATLTVIDEIQFSPAASWEEVGAEQSPQLFGDYYSQIIHVKKTHRMKQRKKLEAQIDKLLAAAASGEADAYWQRQQYFVAILKQLDEEWREVNAKATLFVAEKAAAYIKQHFDTNVSNSLLAKETGYHINYIARCMDEVYSMTPQQYLTYYRIDQAKLMLIRTEQTISQIAQATGFKQTPHFSRLFATYVGISPLRYRKKYTASI